MVNTSVTYEGETRQYNSDGVIIIAIRPTRENGEKNDYGLGMYGQYSALNAIGAIVDCTEKMIESWTNVDDTMDEQDIQNIKKIFLKAVNERFDDKGTITMTADIEINEDLLKMITGQKDTKENENPAKDVHAPELPTKEGWG